MSNKRFEHAEKIAEEIFNSLAKRLTREKLTVADSLHIGIVLSSFIINAASTHSNVTKENVLKDFIEALQASALEEYFEIVKLN